MSAAQAFAERRGFSEWSPLARTRLVRLALTVMTVVVYARTLDFGFSQLDDKRLILDQAEFLGDVGNWSKVFGRSYLGSADDTYYRPLVNLSFLLDADAGSIAAARFHGTNLGLHLCNVLLALYVLQKLGQELRQAFVGASLFALHPVQVASVAWIPGRTDLLFTSFALLSLYSLCGALERPSRWLRGLHGLTFALALFSKETALILPGVLVAACALRPTSERWRGLGWLAWAWGLPLAGYVMARACVIELRPGYWADIAAIAIQRGDVAVADCGRLFVPQDLAVLLEPSQVRVGLGALALCGLALSLRFLPTLRGGRLALCLACIALPLGVSLPGTHLVVLDNRLYLPTLGVALWLGEVLRTCLSARRAVRRSAQISLLLFAGFAAHASYARAADYRDPRTFSEAAFLAAPGSPIARHLRFRQAYAPNLTNLRPSHTH